MPRTGPLATKDGRSSKRGNGPSNPAFDSTGSCEELQSFAGQAQIRTTTFVEQDAPFSEGRSATGAASIRRISRTTKVLKANEATEVFQKINREPLNERGFNDD